MQTRLHESFRDTELGKEADRILRTCVHCGFCNATCPTYQLLGDERDGPRGRIYLIKEALEGAVPTRRTQLHLDRCLTCRACETTCPSGVNYGRLLDIGRQHVEQIVVRSVRERLMRSLLLAVVPWRRRFGAMLRVGRVIRPLIFGGLKKKIPVPTPAGAWPEPRHARRMLVLGGCVQPSAAPNINAAAARLLDRVGVSLMRSDDGCCGAVAHHLCAEHQAEDQMRHNIDVWWPQIENGIEAIVVTASGCGTQLRDYGLLLRGDPQYAAKAARVSELFRDLSQVVADEGQPLIVAHAAADVRAGPQTKIAFQSPCSLQHGLKIRGLVESLLIRAGFTVVPVADGHLCCGSAGTYSILQPALSQRLKVNKLAALQANAPDVIATANIGCLLHLSADAGRPVRHWIELLDERLRQGEGLH